MRGKDEKRSSGRLTRPFAAVFALGFLACGGDTNSGATAGESGTDGIQSAGGPNSSSESDSDDGSGMDSNSGDSNSGSDSSASETKFDVGAPDGGLACGGGLGNGAGTLSYIWIANSAESTVSKINTQTMVEEGRYVTRDDSNGSPSRTSVALSGNVAVANRNGGVIKIYQNVEDCQESNGTPGIQTSTDGTALAWGEEECLAWYTPFSYSTQRPVAWAQGTLNPSTCKYENEKLWTAGRAGGSGTDAEVLLLDGETGVVEQMATITNSTGWAGLYGGAVDGDGNFWTVDHTPSSANSTTLIRVNRSDMSVDRWPTELEIHYGLAVDTQGRAWLCAGGVTSRFDPSTQTWTHPPPPPMGMGTTPSGNRWGGCMTDGQGILWHSRQGDGVMLGIDTETLEIVRSHPLPAYVHGVSIDFDGFVWGVEFNGNNAYRLDPVTGAYDTYSDLNGAYTYSDMTGFALSSVGAPSG